MKITRLRTQVVHLPIDPPIVTAVLGSIRSANCVLTFLDTAVTAGFLKPKNRKLLRVALGAKEAVQIAVG